jgi:Planctomycete cytochrome C.
MRDARLSPLFRRLAVVRRHGIRCRSSRLIVLILLACSLVRPRWAAAVESVDFRHHVAPLLETHCLGCHSKNIAKGELSLASRDLLFENGYVVPGDPEWSYLLELIAGVDGEPPEMPQEAEPLSAERWRSFALDRAELTGLMM